MKKLLLSGVLAMAFVGAEAGPKDGEIPGYTYGDKAVQTAPFTLADLENLKKSLLLTDDDLQWLRKSREILEPQAEEILDTWYGFVGSQPHLLYYFHNRAGKPDGDYLARVRARFKVWITDTANANYDQRWLDYQYEIGRRHHRVAKNRTDDATGPDHIPMSHVIALTVPVTSTLKPFLEKGPYSAAEVDAMQAAWLKSVLLQTILWSHPYVKAGDF
ncbi:MAG: protoglobin domain-containing protein [Pseudomonadota bacterium]